MSAVSVLLAPTDEAFGERITDALSRQGHTARILSGEAADLLVDGDIGDDASIVVWSNAALKLAALHEQAREALEKGALIPVAVDGAAPPSEFESLPPIDLSEWGGDEDDPRWRFVLETLAVATTLRRTGDVQVEADKYYEMPTGKIPRTTPRRRPRRPRRRGIDPNAVAAAGVASLCLMTGAAIIIMPSIVQKQHSSFAKAPAPDAARPAELATLQPVTPTAETRPMIIPKNAETSLTVDAAEADAGAPAEDEPEGFGEGDISYPEDDQLTDSPADAIHLAMLGPVAPIEEAPDDSQSSAGARADLGPTAPSLKPATETDPVPDNIDSLIASVPELTGAAGDIFKDCIACPDMAVIAAGAFVMGPASGDRARANEGPAKSITLAKSFAIATREVTFAEWDACVADGGCSAYKPSDHGWGRGEQPVVSVSFDDAIRYTTWLSAKTGHVYRLPSEAEWEYAARAGTTTVFSFGDGLSSANANYDGRYVYAGKRGRWIGRPKATASYPANAFGLYDMHGNVWEWTADCWSASLSGAPADGRPRGGTCAKRVLKGGAFNTGGWRLRAAHRIGKPARAQEMEIGFRVVRDLG